MRHSYTYQNNKLNPLRLTILALALLADLVNIFMIPSAIIDHMYILYIALVFIGFLGLRIATIYMTYQVEYSYYKGVLKVDKIYYRKPITFINVKKSEIKSISLYNGEDVEAKSIYSKTCIFDKYLVELTNGDKYILSLDDTMYAALTCEEEYDLFR